LAPAAAGLRRFAWAVGSQTQVALLTSQCHPAPREGDWEVDERGTARMRIVGTDDQEEQSMEHLRGKFLVFDGPDGSGKSSQRERVANKLTEAGLEVVVCRDPGGTEIGERIRSVLLDHDLADMAVNCETLLFMASRAQLVHEVIAPALAAGKTVLCDRFVSATCAYQGAAGYDPRRVVEMAHFAIDEHWPDLTIIFDVDVDEGFKRIGRQAKHAGKNRKKFAGQPALFDTGDSVPDAMEARPIEFHRRVRQLFSQLHEYYPPPVVTVDGSRDEEDVHQQVIEVLANVSA
jgi:dTMP kinase